MFRSNRNYDELSKRNVELARQVRDLNHENKYLYEENRDLRFEIEKLHEDQKRILALATSNTYNNAEVILRKIKEVIQSTNINNF